MEIFERMVRANSEDYDLLILGGDLYARLCKKERKWCSKAEALYSKAGEINPKLLTAPNRLIKLYIGMGHLDRALSGCEKILKRNPNDMEAIKSTDLLWQNKLISFLDECIERYPNLSDFYAWKAVQLWKRGNLGDNEEGEILMKIAIKKNSRNYEHRFEYAKYLASKSRVKEAITQLREAIGLCKSETKRKEMAQLLEGISRS